MTGAPTYATDAAAAAATTTTSAAAISAAPTYATAASTRVATATTTTAAAAAATYATAAKPTAATAAATTKSAPSNYIQASHLLDPHQQRRNGQDQDQQEAPPDLRHHGVVEVLLADLRDSPGQHVQDPACRQGGDQGAIEEQEQRKKEILLTASAS